jgi:hypothetical protein
MRAGNPEVAVQKPTARSSVSNGRDILPDAWDRRSVHPSRTWGTGNRREVAIRLAADVVFKPDCRSAGCRRTVPANPACKYCGSCTVTTISGCVGLILRMRRSEADQQWNMRSTQGAQMKPYCGG